MKRIISKKILMCYLSLFIFIFLFIFLFDKASTSLSLLNRDTYGSYDTVSEDRQFLWNKMKVTGGVISKRETGTSFNSSSSYPSSNMNGIDISPDDEYVKTNDYVYYTVELNIDANTDVSGVTDASEFDGGVIKFKATLPKSEDGKTYLKWNTERWMENTILTDNSTVLTGEYVVPKGTNLVGAIQQLTFTAKASSLIAELDEGPTFEFWMEGNSPDNESGHISNVNTYKIVDEELKITAQYSGISLSLSDGHLKRYGYNEDGVWGQYWVIGVYAYSTNRSSYGYLMKKYDEVEVEFELSFSYKELHPDTGAALTGWKTVSEGDEIYEKTIGNAQLLAYNRNGDLNDNAYPNNKSNYYYGMGGFSSSSYTVDNKIYKFDSGNVTASLDGNILTLKNDSIDSSLFEYLSWDNSCVLSYYYSSSSMPGNMNSWSSFCYNDNYYFRDAIEIFVPYTELGTTDRDYQLKITAKEISAINTQTEEVYNTRVSNSLTATYSDQSGTELSGDVQINGSSNSRIAFGSNYNIYSSFSAVSSGYYGEERLINVDSSRFEIVDYFSISSGNVSKNDVELLYGVYKDDLIEGLNGSENLTASEEVNSKDINDFYWYNSIEEAKACEDLKEQGLLNTGQTCRPTSIYVFNPTYTGQGEFVSYYFRIKAREDLLNKLLEGEILSGSIRQKIRAYRDESHSKDNSVTYYYDNAVDSYTPAVYGEGLSISSNSSPSYAGASAAIYGDSISASITTLDKEGNSKTNYNVSDDYVTYAITPSLSSSISRSDLEKDDVIIIARIPTGLTFDINTANVLPTLVDDETSSSYTYVVWEFKNCSIAGSIPGTCDGYDENISRITFNADISPLIENNTSKYVNVYYASNYSYNPNTLTLGSKKYRYYSSSQRTVYFTNLSGSYTRLKSNYNGVSPNHSFTITNSIYNNSQGSLVSNKSIQILPYNGDQLGSSYRGDYTLKVLNKEDNQKIFYTTNNIDNIGITYDVNGKMTIEMVDLENDSRWKEVNVGEVIPSKATAVASLITEIANKSLGEYTFEFIPNNNLPTDKYVFKSYVSSDNLSSSITTNSVVVNVYDRVISGYAFNDKNRNNLFDDGEEYANLEIKLYNDEHTLIDTVITDNDGYYLFNHLLNDDYYIVHDINENYEFVTKNAGIADVSSMINQNGKTDLINELSNVILIDDVIVDNVNIGLRQKQASLIVHHYIEGTTTELVKTENEAVYWGDEYSTSSSKDVSENYELISTPGNASGTIKGDVVVNYYYKLKEATLTVHHYIEGTTTELAPTEVKNVHWGDEYNTSFSKDVSENYELVSTPGNASGTIKGDVVVNYYYKLKEATLTVHHYIEGTTTELASTEVSKVYWGNQYNTSSSSKVSENYELVSKPDNASGTIKGDVVVTYYYRLKKSILTVKYLEYKTNKELASTITKNLYWGDTYSTVSSKDVTANYELYSKTDNFEGIVSSNEIIVVYYYQKKDSLLETTISKTGTEEYTDVDQKIDYKINYEAKITDYLGPVKVVIVDTLPYAIDAENSNLDGGIYDENKKTITWIIDESSIDASVSSKNLNVIKNISLKYKDVILTERSMVNTVSGEIVLDNNSRTIESKLVTYIKVKGKIIVHHYVEGTTEKVVDDIETTGLIGENYVSSSITKVGYEIVKEPENKNHVYINGTLDVIYEYRRLKFNIVTKVNGNGGGIVGDETVYYGEDSTKDKIVITPYSGYHVSKILINNEEYDVDICRNGCVLGNFDNVLEDKEVIVYFEEDIIVNPDTSILKYSFVIVLFGMFGLIFIFIKLYRKRIVKI